MNDAPTSDAENFALLVKPETQMMMRRLKPETPRYIPTIEHVCELWAGMSLCGVWLHLRVRVRVRVRQRGATGQFF